MLRRTAPCLLACALLTSLAAAPEPALRLDPQAGATWEKVPDKARPVASATRLTAAPKIDGALDEPFWATAAAIERFDSQVNVPEEARTWVTARLAFDRDALYIGARLRKPGGELRATVSQDGGRIWGDDCLELFLGSADGSFFYQVDVNGLGAHWAGATKVGLNWAPAVRTAARIREQDWTVEVAIPWADLGVTDPEKAALPFELRYLVGGGAGQTAWAAGTRNLADSGLLRTLPASATGAPLHFLRFRYPDRLPPGTTARAIEVELRNPGAQPRQAIVRLGEPGTGRVTAQEIVQVPAGATQSVALPVTLAPGEEKALALYVRDAHEELRLLASRRVAALKPLALSFHRERAWTDDPRFAADLAVGLPTDGQGRIEVELWDDLRRLARTEQPLAASAFALDVDLTGQPAGQYRLRATARAGDREERLMAVLTLQPGVALPERQRVPLRVDWPEGNALEGPALLYAGVSFPAGTLRELDTLRVIEADGAEVPAQAEVLARWSPNGAVKWAGVRFLGRRGVEYAVEVGRDLRHTTPVEPLRVEDTPAALVVHTGVARFELPKTGPLISRARIGEEPVIESKGGCLLVTDQKGRTADETRGGAAEGPVVETAGPVAAVIRREGLLRTAQGERLGKYVVRLTFAYHSPTVAIQHTFINTEDTNRTQYSDIALRLRPAFSGPWRAGFAAEGAEAMALDPAVGDAAYMLQSLYKHHQQPACAYTISLRRGAAGAWAKASEGAICGDWGAVSGGRAGLAVAIAHLPKLFPKEIEVAPDGLTAHLWSGRGGRNLDYRAPAISEYFGPEWFEKLYPGGLEGFNATYTDAAGSARTHDLLLHLFPATAPRAQMAAALQLASRPVLAIQDPAWLRDTDALGPIHPRDPKEFPRIESYLDNFFTAVDKRGDAAGDYGFLDYGNGPHTYSGGPRMEGRPRFYRYYEMDYQWRTVLWLLYARSGDRAVYDYALRYNRHLNDFLFAWWPARNKPLGAMLTTGDGEVPLYWRSRASFWGSQGINLNNAFYHYYLSGDRRVHDGALLFGDHIASTFDPLVLPNAVAGANHNPYECLVDLYAATWDERYGRPLRACRERMIDLDTGSGLVNQSYYGAWYKPHIRVWVHLKDYLATGSDLARKGCLKWFEQMLMHEPIDGPGYQNHDGLFMNHAWRLTGDARYARWAAERIARVEHAWRDPARFSNLNHTDGNHLLTFLGSAPYALDLIVRARGQGGAWPFMAAGAEVYFVKEREDSPRLAVRCNATPELYLTRAYEKLNEEMRAGFHSGPVQIDLRPYYFAPTPEGGTAPNYAEVRLPKEAFAGEYRVTGATAVLDANVRKIVLVAPEGALLPAVVSPAPPWYFQLPKGRKGAIYTTRPLVMEWEGGRAVVPAGQWHPLSGGEVDELRTLRLTESAFVRFQGDIPPVLAQRSPDRFFIPKAAPRNAALAELEDPKATYVAGSSGAEGNKGFLLNGTRTLEAPRGKPLDRPGAFEFLDARRGTLEFWFKPQWTSSLLPAGARKQIIRWNGWQLAYENGAFAFLAQAAVTVYPYQHQVLFNRTAVEQGKWYHVALCWDYDAARRMWLSELYVNGKPSGVDQGRPGVGLTRCGANDKQFTNLDVAVPGGPFVFLGEADAVIDELRISSVPRYPKPFLPLDPNPLPTDKDTLFHLRLDGSTARQ
jgi:hypothetical protein